MTTTRPGFRTPPKKKKIRRAPDIRRNTHVEKGRIVTLNDIRPYARMGCQRCRAHSGLSKLVKSPEGAIIGAEPCKCATTRFYKAHPEVIVERTGHAFWPADREEPTTTAEPATRREAITAPYNTIQDSGTAIEQRETREPEPGETDEPK